MSVNDGGPAFPSSGNPAARAQAEGFGMQYQPPQGVTIREYFAAKALPALITQCHKDDWNKLKHASYFDYVACEAYRAADAMLKAGRKKP